MFLLAIYGWICGVRVSVEITRMLQSMALPLGERDDGYIREGPMYDVITCHTASVVK